MYQWTQTDAVKLATEIEKICPLAGYHIGLTGGLLYKEGERKDCDFIFYQIRNSPQENAPGADKELLLKLLVRTGIEIKNDHGFVVKCKYDFKDLDLLFPEEELGNYPHEQGG